MQRTWVLLCALVCALLMGASTTDAAKAAVVEQSDAALEAEVELELAQEAEAEEEADQEEEGEEEEAEEAEEEEAEEEEAEEEAEEEEADQEGEEEEAEEEVEEEEAEEEVEEEEEEEEEQEEEEGAVELEMSAQSEDAEAQDILAELDAPADAEAGMQTIEDDPAIAREEFEEIQHIAVESDQHAAETVNPNLHESFLPYTHPMELLPEALAELKSEAQATTKEDEEGGDDAGGGGGKNPTYILPVDPFNYYPFFNGFSNVNPFSQFYPPPPYLYPQYVNHMQRYASRSNPTPPFYPVPAATNLPAVGANYPTNSPAPFPHLYYPFGAYKLDTNGPDIPSGANSPAPFPQFVEESATVRPHLLTEDSAFRHPEQDSFSMSEDEGIEVSVGNFPQEEAQQIQPPVAESDVYTTEVEYSN